MYYVKTDLKNGRLKLPIFNLRRLKTATVSCKLQSSTSKLKSNRNITNIYKKY